MGPGVPETKIQMLQMAGVNLRHTLSCLENINIIVLSGRYKHYYPAWKIQTSLACLADTNTIAPSGRYKYHYPVSRVDNQRKVFFSVHIMTLMPVCKHGQSRVMVVVNRQRWRRSRHYGGPLCTSYTGTMSLGERAAPMPGG